MDIKEKLIHELSLSELPTEVREAILEQGMMLVTRRVLQFVEGQLEGNIRVRYESLVEAGDNEAVLALLLEEIPTIREFVDQEVASFITESKQVLNQ